MLFAPYIGTMQAGPDSGILGPSHLEKFDIGEDIPMHNPLSANVGNTTFVGHAPKSTVLTRLQQKNKAVIAQSKNLALAKEPEVPPAAPKNKNVPKKKRSQKKDVTKTEQGVDQQDSNLNLGQAKNAYMS